MMNMIRIVRVAQDGEDGILVTFSDGTTAGYIVEELLELRPIREESPFKARRRIMMPSN